MREVFVVFFPSSKIVSVYVSHSDFSAAAFNFIVLLL